MWCKGVVVHLLGVVVWCCGYTMWRSLWCKGVVVHLLGSGSVVLWLHYEEVSVSVA